MTFLRTLIVNGLMSFDMAHAERELIYQDQNDSSNSSGSLQFMWSFYLYVTQWMQYTVVLKHIGGLNNPCSGVDNVKHAVVMPVTSLASSEDTTFFLISRPIMMLALY